MTNDRARPTTPQKDWLRALERTARIERQPARIFSTVIEEMAALRPTAPALIARDGVMTYGDLSAQAARYTNWAVAQGIGRGDRVGLLMANAADYVAIWLGVSRTGAIVALLNTNLKGAALAHCIAAADARHVIVGAGLTGVMAAALPELARRPRCWVHGADGADFEPILPLVAAMPPVVTEVASATIADAALLIYTSGTTGLPKAAYVSHRRIMQWTHWFAGLTDMRGDDRVFNCLPLYHSVGGVVAVGAALAGGGSVVVRERFSASGFWDDVIASESTIFQYIGELCRYLVAAKSNDNETRHRLRLAVGNGLAGDVWETFQARFAIPRIIEFYAATEGNFSLYNLEGKVGSIGRIPPFLAHRSNVALIGLDDDGRPQRGADGLCMAAGVDAAGEAIGEMRGEQTGRFEGYADTAATEKKIVRDVFAKGDAWVRSGDLMRRDGQGFFFFVDRVGDTFRWKGENVATTDVTAAIGCYAGVTAATVYGVAVPGADGRAGMAALVTDAAFDMGGLAAHLAKRLPGYAQPLFVRLCADLETTATYRPKKQDLAKAGFDPGASGEPIYFRDPSRQDYVRLDADTYARIVAGAIKV